MKQKKINHILSSLKNKEIKGKYFIAVHKKINDKCYTLRKESRTLKGSAKQRKKEKFKQD